MAGWSRQANRDRDVLMRIVALLVALADLAERAAGLRGRRRRHLLRILNYAEAEGHDFIVGLMPHVPKDCHEPELAGDPARLAASFRVLALVLYTMLQRRFAFSRAVGWLDAGRGGFKRSVGRDAIGAPDTS